MNGEPASIPGFFELVWMLFMQPVRLHQRLRACGIEPDASGWRLWREPEPTREAARTYVRIMALLLFAITPAGALILGGVLHLAGYSADYRKLAVGVAVGVAFGVAGAVAFGVAGAVAFGVAFGVALGVALGVAFGVAFGVAGGVALAVAVGVARGVSFGVTGGVALGVALTVAGGVVLGVAGGVAAGVAGGVAASLSFLRLPLYPIEALFQTLLYTLQGAWGVHSFPLSPVLHHDLSYLPHPFLARHILLEAEADPEVARRALEACAIAPGQQRAGRVAQARLQARELEALARSHRFSEIVELQGRWLPGVEGAGALLLGVRETARYLAAAGAAGIPYHRLEHLRRAEQSLQALENQLLSDHSDLARALPGTLDALRQILREMRGGAESAAASQIPNPFVAGEPLTPEQGRQLFRGREALVRQIEVLLADPDHSASIVLLGPRRCGKTSLLKMLPALLPDAQCVFFDLQDNPVDSAAGFFAALARQAREQARRDRQWELPPLPEGSAFEAGAAWFQALEEAAGNRRILISIDEFERLEELFPGDRRELLQLMGLFRATIQHRHKVRLLVSGVAPFDELGRLWDDHFINAREIRVGHLDRPTASDLLTRPIPEFPEEAIPLEVADAIFERTGGQPYLLQLYGSLLVTRLNDHDRHQARPEDVPAVEEQVLSQAASYFRHTIQAAPREAREALECIARGQSPPLDIHVRRWLDRRCLITGEDRLRIPVLGAWIHHEVLA